MRTVVTCLSTLILLLACSVASANDKTKDSEVEKESTALKIRVASLIVDDQDKAEKFYTEVLGFEVKENVPAGEFIRLWEIKELRDWDYLGRCCHTKQSRGIPALWF